jgi:hypothetical protein
VKNNNQASVSIYHGIPEDRKAAEDGLQEKANATQGRTNTSPAFQKGFDSGTPDDDQNNNPFESAIRSL